MLKLTCAKWHFAQVGQGIEKPHEMPFWLIFLVKNIMMFHSVIKCLIVEPSFETR
jgi:hypothetical protein